MQDSAEVIVAAEGDVAVAPVGTTLPTTPTAALNAAFQTLGYLTTDGVTLTDGVTIEEIRAWQKQQPIRKIVTARTKTAAFEMQQWNRQNFVLAYGGGAWTSPSSGVYRFDPPADSEAVAELAMVIDWVDGEKNHRLVIPRGLMQEGVTTKLIRTGSAVLPITFAALTPDGADRSWYHLTDDDAFALGS